MVNIAPKNKAFTDLTGKFPQCSSHDYQYVLVTYHFDGNIILAEPLKNHSATSIPDAWKIMNDKFTIIGMRPNTHILSNEVSQTLTDKMTTENIPYQ